MPPEQQHSAYFRFKPGHKNCFTATAWNEHWQVDASGLAFDNPFFEAVSLLEIIS